MKVARRPMDGPTRSLFNFRHLSVNEEKGDYTITAFTGFAAPAVDDGKNNHQTLLR
jgi:hypothetical protein